MKILRIALSILFLCVMAFFTVYNKDISYLLAKKVSVTKAELYTYPSDTRLYNLIPKECVCYDEDADRNFLLFLKRTDFEYYVVDKIYIDIVEISEKTIVISNRLNDLIIIFTPPQNTYGGDKAVILAGDNVAKKQKT